MHKDTITIKQARTAIALAVVAAKKDDYRGEIDKLSNDQIMKAIADFEDEIGFGLITSFLNE